MAAPLAPAAEAELDAFEAVCKRLGGFDPELGYERVDGFLAGLAAAPRLPPTAEWLQALFGDTYDRVFADPEDRAQALAVLQGRLDRLCLELDPQALFDDPEVLRLQPLMADWDEAERERAQDELGLDAEELAVLQIGAVWAMAFLDATEAFPALWAEPDDPEAAAAFSVAFDQIAALVLAPGSEEWQRHVAEYYPEGEPTRDELVGEALWSVQDLRMYWVDFTPVTAPRRVEPQPGRNDPCPCGSGRKFKKCHGA